MTVAATLEKKPLYEYRMNPEIKTVWVEALRSGEYKQSKSALHRVWQDGEASGFCCLGVLCKIGADKGALVAGQTGGLRVNYRLKDSEEAPYDMMPTEGIREWAGLTGNAMDNLAHLNDMESKSFAEIADHIEEHL